MTADADPPSLDPAGVVRATDPPPSNGILLRIVVSVLEAALAVVVTFVGVLFATFCDGDEAGSGLCDGSTPRETVMLVAVGLFGAVVLVGALASVLSPGLDRRRILYRVPAVALLLVATVGADAIG